MATRELKLVGWGYEGDEITDVERQMVTSRMRERFGGEFEILRAQPDDVGARIGQTPLHVCDIALGRQCSKARRRCSRRLRCRKFQLGIPLRARPGDSRIAEVP